MSKESAKCSLSTTMSKETAKCFATRFASLTLHNLRQYGSISSIEGNDQKALHSIRGILIRNGNNPRTLKTQSNKMMIPKLDKFVRKATNAAFEELEEAYQKYNIPKRDSCESFEPYLARIREFMKDTWRETAEKSRQKGHKCLMEWMVELHNSEDAEMKRASKSVNIALTCLGFEISQLLTDFLSMISELGEMTEKLHEVETVIRCFSIEEGSAVIESFASVVNEFHRMLSVEKKAKQEGQGKNGNSKGIRVDDSLWFKKVAELHHLIMIEVLRLEVSFQSPDLPMILMSPMYHSMARHLLANVFHDKLNAINDEMKELKAESCRQWTTDSFDEILTMQIEEIWSRLEWQEPDE